MEGPAQISSIAAKIFLNWGKWLRNRVNRGYLNSREGGKPGRVLLKGFKFPLFQLSIRHSLVTGTTVLK
jgi:hypothetical protein